MKAKMQKDIVRLRRKKNRGQDGVQSRSRLRNSAKHWESLTECAEKDWDLDVKHVKAHRTEKEKRAITKLLEFVMEGNEKTDELAKA